MSSRLFPALFSDIQEFQGLLSRLQWHPEAILTGSHHKCCWIGYRTSSCVADSVCGRSIAACLGASNSTYCFGLTLGTWVVEKFAFFSCFIRNVETDLAFILGRGRLQPDNVRTSETLSAISLYRYLILIACLVGNYDNICWRSVLRRESSVICCAFCTALFPAESGLKHRPNNVYPHLLSYFFTDFLTYGS